MKAGYLLAILYFIAWLVVVEKRTKTKNSPTTLIMREVISIHIGQAGVQTGE
jgi:hypothetical protein